MVRLIIPTAWIVVFQLTSQVSFSHTALYSDPRECWLSLNVELGMAYSNCCHLKCGPIGVSQKKICVLLYLCECNSGTLFYFFVVFFCVLPRLCRRGINLFKSTCTISLVGGDSWGAKTRLVKSVTSLNIIEVHVHRWPTGGTVASQFGKQPSGAVKCLRWIRFLV